MTQRLSVYLDLLRFLAAIIVLLSHFAYERFSGGSYLFIREFNLGSDAVVVFFALSGFVIAYAAKNKDKRASTYFFNRTTRIFSVIIPALAFTYVLDQVGSYVSPDVYNGWWYHAMPMGQFFAQGLTFSNEWNGLAVRLGTNGPYWSISYEVAYYGLFGVAMYCRGVMRIALIACLVAIFGLNIILLLPIWLMGAFCYSALQQQQTANKGIVFAAFVRAGIYLPLLCYLVALGLGIPEYLKAATGAFLGVDPNLALRFSDEFIWNYLIGLLFTWHLYAVATAMLQSDITVSKIDFGGRTKWLAGASFSLYLVHYPLLQFLSAVLPDLGYAIFNQAVLLGMTITICFCFAEVFERNLDDFRELCLQLPRLRKA